MRIEHWKPLKALEGDELPDTEYRLYNGEIQMLVSRKDFPEGSQETQAMHRMLGLIPPGSLSKQKCKKCASPMQVYPVPQCKKANPLGWKVRLECPGCGAEAYSKNTINEVMSGNAILCG
jgi:hypothetical protein